MSDSTVANVNGFIGRPIGTLMLEGKEQGIAAFEPISEDAARSDATKTYLAAFELLAAEDPKAKQSFAAVVGTYEDDPLANYHLQRLLAGESGVRIVLPGK